MNRILLIVPIFLIILAGMASASLATPPPVAHSAIIPFTFNSAQFNVAGNGLVSTTSSGGGTPGLPFNSLQYNNGGAFGGLPTVTWNSLDNGLIVSNGVFGIAASNILYNNNMLSELSVMPIGNPPNNPSGTGYGGANILLITGPGGDCTYPCGAGNGGNFTVNTGKGGNNSVGASAGGNFIFMGGSGNWGQGGSGVGGGILFVAGQGGGSQLASSGGKGGSITMISGPGNIGNGGGSPGGDFKMVSGSGGVAPSGGGGGNFNISAGLGGAMKPGTSFGDAGIGGSFVLSGGLGGNAIYAASYGNAGNGGSATFSGGNGGPGNTLTSGPSQVPGGNGGNLYFLPGSGGVGATNGKNGIVAIAVNSLGGSFGLVGIGTINPTQKLSLNGSMTLNGMITNYNAINTQGYGVPPIYSANDVITQTGNDLILCKYTPKKTGTFAITGYEDINSISVDTLQMQIIYTDPFGSSTTYSFGALQTGTGDYPLQSVSINNLGTNTITVNTILPTSTGSLSYDAGCTISELT